MVENMNTNSDARIQAVPDAEATTTVRHVPHLPVLIVPGFMSSGLEVQTSTLQPNWEGQRLWLNLVTLGVSSFVPAAYAVPEGTNKNTNTNGNGNETTAMEETNKDAGQRDTDPIPPPHHHHQPSSSLLFSSQIFDEDNNSINDDDNDCDDTERNNNNNNDSTSNQGVRASVLNSLRGSFGRPRRRSSTANSSTAAAAAAAASTSEQEQQQHRIRNLWLRHMALSNIDLQSEYPGVTVRAMDGLAGVDYLTPGNFTSHLSYVFGPLIKVLEKVGYRKGYNLEAVPYDWRLNPQQLQSRDHYYTKTIRTIERMYHDNNKTPIVLVCHSMGCKVAHYFFNWVLDNYTTTTIEETVDVATRTSMPACTGGQDWLDRHIHTYMCVGGPHLGAPKALRGAVVGDRMGLEAFLKPSQGLALARSFGSTPWLIPPSLPTTATLLASSIPTDHHHHHHQYLPPPACAYIKREGAFKVSIKCTIYVGDWFRYREKNHKPKRLRLLVKYYNCEELFTAFSPVVNDTVSFDDVFVFAEHYHGPSSSQQKRCCACCGLRCIMGCSCCACCTKNTLLIGLCEPGLQIARKHVVPETKRYNSFCLYWNSMCTISCWKNDQSSIPMKILGTLWCIIKPVFFWGIVVTYWVLYKFWLICGDHTNKATGNTTVLTAIEPINMAEYVGAPTPGGINISSEFAQDFQWGYSSLYDNADDNDDNNDTNEDEENRPSSSNKVSMNIQWISSEMVLADSNSPRIADLPQHQHQQFGEIGELISVEDHRRKKKKRKNACDDDHSAIYDQSSGFNLLKKEGCDPTMQLLSNTYDTDPIDPRNCRSSIRSPPVRRVKAIYGINIPTEIGAIYKRKSAVKAAKNKINTLFTIDTKSKLFDNTVTMTEAELQEYDKINNNKGENYRTSSNSLGYVIEGGIIKETKNTFQTIMRSPLQNNTNDERIERERRRRICGDGIVPYYSLQVPRTWQSDTCHVDIVELPEADHREILDDTRFHSVLIDYVTTTTTTTT